MNEIERLIAAVRRPEPSEKLDQAISCLLRRQQPVYPRDRRRKNTRVLCATAVCAAAIGFVGGRVSVAPVAGYSPAIARVPVTNPQSKSAADSSRVTSLPLTDEQLAGLFIPITEDDGIFGNGPIEIEITGPRQN